MNPKLIASILCVGLLASPIVPAQVETITTEELQKLKENIDKQKESVIDPVETISNANTSDIRELAVDYLSFIVAVYAKTKVMPASNAALKKNAPKDFEQFKVSLDEMRDRYPHKHFTLSYGGSKLNISYKGKPLLTYSVAKVEKDDIGWRCNVASKVLSKQIDKQDPNDPPDLLNIGGEDCRETVVYVPTAYQLSN